jgi:thiamine-monophosphate kinase
VRLDELGEFGFLARVQGGLPRGASGVVLGSGDDAAVLAWGDRLLLVSTDAMVEGRHFCREWLTLGEIGERAARAALSDLAAMGGTARGLLASVAFPPNIEATEAEALARGLEAGAASCGAHLLGGDLVASPGPLFLDVTVIGEAQTCWPRSGAQVGDLLLVSGDLGRSAAALALLARGAGVVDLPAALRERFLRPQPAFDLVSALQPLGTVTAAIDLSDGLLADLGHVAEASGVQLRVDAGSVPLAPATGQAACGLGLEAVPLALSSGEEYELAFTVPREALPGVQQAVADRGARAVTVIGEAVAGSGVVVEGAELPPAGGWDHFSAPATTAD